MTAEQINWTDCQRRAIDSSGRRILVTASAGTGKTAVLSGRCVRVVSDNLTCPGILQTLVLTFTEAAAEQMRRRIAGQLRLACRRGGAAGLHRQLMLLPAADIGTIHSFCKRIISEHFYELGLDPGFGIIDGDEQKLLKAEVLAETMDWAWRQNNLEQALSLLLRRRDTRAGGDFCGRIVALSNFLDGLVSRQAWYERALRLTAAEDPGVSELGARQKQIVASRLQEILNQLRHAKAIYAKQAGAGDWSEKLQEQMVSVVSRSLANLQAGKWDGCVEQIRRFAKPRVNKPKDIPAAAAELVRSMAADAARQLADLADLAVVNPDYLSIVGGSVSLQSRVVIELTRQFDRFYSRTKRTANCLDFADLEHFALRLLRGEAVAESSALTDTAAALQRHYKYIFVDEYQDINPVQQAILDSLAGDGQVFVVGDVKQSIYAFRGAEPKIFLRQLETAATLPAGDTPHQRVDLTDNFRSTEPILCFVNHLFSRVMTAGLSDIDYDRRAQLQARRPDAGSVSASAVELHILDEQNLDTNETLGDAGGDSCEGNRQLAVVTARQRQAAIIAQRIRRMVGAASGQAEFHILDPEKNTYRPVEYRDIVILMRSPARRVNDYIEVLRLAGVPVSCQLGAGYFQATEVSDILCLLKVLDNPQRDIELAALLRSWFFRFSDTELARLRLAGGRRGGGGDFYQCVVGYGRSGDDVKLAEKVRRALEQIDQWRSAARRGSLAELLWRIYRQSGCLWRVLALPNGQARRANLLKLHQRAIEFEGFASSTAGGPPGRFVAFVEKLQEAGGDWATAEPEAQVENAVRIMSIHKSKGLEFPVVFVAELGAAFNMRDRRRQLLADAENTLGLQVIDASANVRLDSLGHQIITESRQAAALAEEMRILYVAMTRARDRLILTASEKHRSCLGVLTTGYFFGGGPIPDWQLRRCGNCLDWILYGLSDQGSVHKAFESDLAERAEDAGLLSLKVYGRSRLESLAEYILELNRGKAAPGSKQSGQQPADGAVLRTPAQLKRSLCWRYPFSGLSAVPAKQSVTELTHGQEVFDRVEACVSLERQPQAVLDKRTVAAQRVDGRLLGQACHLVISELDLGAPLRPRDIRQTVERLVAAQKIPAVLAGHIDIEAIAAFFDSSLGRLALEPGQKVLREWPFTFALPAADWLGEDKETSSLSLRATGETVIVQGIVDMLICGREGLVVIDFKTDEVVSERAAALAERYRRQVWLYGQAAAAILKAELAGRWLYFLAPGCAVEV